MKIAYKFICYIIVFASLFQTACMSSKPIVRDINSDAYPNVYSPVVTDGNFKYNVLPIIDKRPEIEKGGTEKSYSVFIPLLIYFQFGCAKNEYCKEKFFDDNLLPNLQELTSRVLNGTQQSNKTESATLDVEIELLHYYGHHYEKNMFLTGAGFFYTFFPDGFVSMKIKLLKNNEIIDSCLVNSSFLFSPFLDGTSLEHTAFSGIRTKDLVNNYSLTANYALKKLMTELSGRVAEMASGLQNGNNMPDEIDDFLVIRLTKEYNYYEEACIDYPTGEILSDTIKYRKIPIISKPDEWIVAPYTSKGKWIGKEGYKDLVEKLGDRYDVSFVDNLNAANFYGTREN